MNSGVLMSAVGSAVTKWIVETCEELNLTKTDISEIVRIFSVQLVQEAEELMQKGCTDGGSEEGMGAGVEPGEY
ncbi:MAG TPA: hypothetical protein H9761_17130 [Candidatus Eisenbergiella merdavium]|uniref:Uncharacterized protein n=1 Tax=Candidatus Eisenbergiella merdavium TaxID=2838551 RepID=A0A9D2SQU4_9FIRM|nr:hypothetical protein [Candidatus Eisenbergiella merdavium]